MEGKTLYFPNIEKIPPQAIDCEESVLGICLSYPDAIFETKLKPEMFYKDAHRKIFDVILEVAGRGVCDSITVVNKLRDKNELDSVGGPVYIVGLTSKIVSMAQLETHVLIIKEKYLLRKYIELGSQLGNMGFTEDLSDVVEYAESTLFSLSDFTQTREPESLAKCIDEVISEVEKIISKEKSLIGISSGFTEVDRITGGWQGGNLVIIAGRPSMGKTALSLTLSLNCARLGYPVGMFSLEMSKGELSTRYLSSASGYTNVEIRNGKIDFDKFVSKSNDVALFPIYIDDTPSMGLFEMRSKVKKLIVRHGVKMIIVDYLQLMTAEAGNREQEVSKISRGLKSIAKEFNVPVIALSQLNRAVEERADKRPRLADLRESGAIEQDADVVCFVFRPGYYNLRTITMDGGEISTEGLMLLDCLKDRNGALFSVPLFHNESMTVIQDTKFEIHNEAF
jgi:replicative DNA helicase